MGTDAEREAVNAAAAAAMETVDDRIADVDAAVDYGDVDAAAAAAS